MRKTQKDESIEFRLEGSWRTILFVALGFGIGFLGGLVSMWAMAMFDGGYSRVDRLEWLLGVNGTTLYTSGGMPNMPVLTDNMTLRDARATYFSARPDLRRGIMVSVTDWLCDGGPITPPFTTVWPNDTAPECQIYSVEYKRSGAVECYEGVILP